MKILDKISYGIDVICSYLIYYLLLIITSVVFIQVVARFVFNTGTFWTDELARFSMVWLVFIGAAVATREKSLINVDVVESLLPKFAKPLRIFQSIVFLIFCALLVKMGWETMWLVAAQRSPNMGVPMSVIYAAIPVTMAIMIFHLIVQLFYKKDQGGSM